MLPATTNTSQANNTAVVVADPTERRFVALANRLDAPYYPARAALPERDVLNGDLLSWTSVPARFAMSRRGHALRIVRPRAPR